MLYLSTYECVCVVYISSQNVYHAYEIQDKFENTLQNISHARLFPPELISLALCNGSLKGWGHK